jgi:predicted permease
MLKRASRRLRALLRRDDVELELDEELRYHLDRQIEQNLAFGMSPEEARSAALRSFDGLEQSKEACRDARGVRAFDDLVQDLRHGLRTLRRSPGFTAVTVLTLALGIGANTAIFSLLDAVLLASLPVQEPEELVLFGKGEDGGLTNRFPNGSTDLFSYPFYEEVRERNEAFSEVAALLSMPWRVHGTVNADGAGGEVEQMDVQLVSGTYFAVLGVRAGLGRTFTEADDQTPGGHPVAVVSHAWWERRLGGDPAAVGRAITIDRTAYTIVGVAPSEFFGTTVGQAPDLWVPLAMEAQMPPAHWDGRTDTSHQSLYLIARLRDGVPVEQASAAVNLLFKQSLHEQVGTEASPERLQDIERASIELTPAGKGISGLRREFSLSLRILMAMVGVVLLIACANVGNLLLGRAVARRREFAVRLAVGAGRGRLVRQLLTESVLLAGLGGVVGVMLAWWGSRLLVVMASGGPEPLPLDVAPDSRVLGFTLLASLLSAVIFGTAPAVFAARVEPDAALKGGKGAARPTTQSALGKALVVAQVALSLVLLVGAGLFVRTLVNLQSVPTGFDQRNVMLFRLDTTTTGYKDAQLARLLRDVEEKVKAVPGVQSAAFSFFVFGPGQWTSPIFTRDRTVPDGQSRNVRQNVVGPDFFDAMGLTLVLGRTFGPQDTGTSRSVAVISEAMAEQFFPDGSPIGRHFGKTPESLEQFEVIGVVRDARYGSLIEQVRPMAYYLNAQNSQPLDNFVVRYSGSPEAVVPQVRRAIREVNRNVPVDEVVSLTEYIGRSLVQQELVARLASFFGLLALLLACVGLYGVLAHSVARRTNEIGIRMALGAQSRDVRWLVLREALTLVLIGVAVGFPASLAATQSAATLLFGLKPTDPLTIASATVLLIAMALVACWLPARRATEVEPMLALRYE